MEDGFSQMYDITARKHDTTSQYAEGWPRTSTTVALNSQHRYIPGSNNTSGIHFQSPLSTYFSVTSGTHICIKPEPWIQTIVFIRYNIEGRYNVIVSKCEM